MRLSSETLAREARATGFRADVLDKVARLLGLLDQMQSHPFLRGKLALKGGTALNLFIFDIPRLSVDIDLNYVGQTDKDAMLQERPKIERAMGAVFDREGYAVRTMPGEHAGGKWALRYQGASGQGGNLEVDVNFMYRVPLWPAARMDSRPVGRWQAVGIPVVDVHELAAGKVAALLSRRKARDLFDAHRVLRMDGLDPARLRLAFVVYGAMNRRDWRTVSIDDVRFDAGELVNRLVPTLRREARPGPKDAESFGRGLVEECRQALKTLLPLTDAEREFLDLLLDKGEIDASILTRDDADRERIEGQPLLKWKALHVRRHRG